MSTPDAQAQEKQHIAEVLAVIQRRIEAVRREHSKGSEELISYRKYMWEDAALFDRAEMVQSENVALTQERAVLDVSIRLKRLSTLASSPYFGRIDFHETGTAQPARIYIGLHALFGDSDDLLIYDWRAPVSSMF